MRLAILSVLLVAGVIVLAYLVIPGPVSRSFLQASLERGTHSSAQTFGGGRGSCSHVRGPRWRCRIQGRRGSQLVAWSVRMKDHACWTARGPAARKPVEGCIHLLEMRVF